MSIVSRVKNRLNCILLRFRGARVERDVFIGKGIDISYAQNMMLLSKSKIYKNCTIYIGEKGKFELGKNSHLAPNAYALIGDNQLVIGNHVAVGPFTTFINHSNHFEGKSNLFCENYLNGDIRIGNNVFIGAQCVILPGTIIEDNVVIASNSVVKGNISSGFIYGGTPCKQIKSIK